MVLSGKAYKGKASNIVRTSSRTIVKLEAIKSIDEMLAGMTCDGSFTGSVLIAQDENILVSKGYGLVDRAQDIPNPAVHDGKLQPQAARSAFKEIPC